MLYTESQRDHTEWLHVRRIFAEHSQKCPGDYGKLVWWDLAEPYPKEEDTLSNSNGLWRLTPHGRSFVERRRHVKKYVWEYESVAQKFGGEWITIIDALGINFNFDELMET